MRILYVGTDRGLFTEGSDVSNRHAHLGEAFQDDSFTSIVFATRAHGIEGKRSIRENVVAYPTQSASRLLYGYDALRIAKKLPRPDIVTAQDPFETGLVGLLIARHFNIPLAVEVHTDILAPGYRAHSALNRFRLVLARFVLPRAAGGYAVSTALRDALVRRYRLTARFEVIPIYVDIERFRALPRAPEKGQLLWIGRLEPEKRPELALTALAAARALGHDVRLTMLGDGSLKEGCVALAKALSVESYVLFPGWKDPKLYLPKTELLLATSSYEGYGMAMVESLAAGVPVLATDTGIARAAGAVVVGADYAASLCTWLAGPRARGNLDLTTYSSEQEYLATIRTFYGSLAARRERLLIITQTVDQDDPILGFFHTWIEGLAAHFPSVTVICLLEGRHELPKNVQVYSLGKEEGSVGKLRYALRFYHRLWQVRNSYDTVFVHMNEEYVLLAGLYWRMRGTSVSLWRNFHSGSWRTTLAVRLATRVFCTSRDSFTAQFTKARIMPVGADTVAFGVSEGIQRVPRSILMLGRIAPVKRIEVLLQALSKLAERHVDFTANIYGNTLPDDQVYFDSLKAYVEEKDISRQVHFHSGVAHHDAPPIFQAHDLFVNLSHSGMYDKTIFEAAAAGALPITANRDYAREADPVLVLDDLDPNAVAQKLATVLSLSVEEKNRLRTSAYSLAANHTLPKLIAVLAHEL